MTLYDLMVIIDKLGDWFFVLIFSMILIILIVVEKFILNERGSGMQTKKCGCGGTFKTPQELGLNPLSPEETLICGSCGELLRQGKGLDIQMGILACVNEMWYLFAKAVHVDDENAPGAIEQFLEEKEKIHKFLIKIK